MPGFQSSFSFFPKFCIDKLTTSSIRVDQNCTDLHSSSIAFIMVKNTYIKRQENLYFQLRLNQNITMKSGC